MGGSAGSFISRIGEGARHLAEDAPDKLKKYGENIGNDPTRVLLDMNGITAPLEGIRAGADEAGIKAAEAAGAGAPLKGLPDEPSAPGSGPGSVPDKIKDYAPARGRASTILTGSHGLGGTPSTARRTLLGV